MTTILLVEDEVTVLTLAESVLKEAGHGTLTAATVHEAEALIGSSEPIDLIFTDMTLHDQIEGGLQIGQLSRARDIPVLYTSGRPITDGMKELFVERSAFLPKPYTNANLIDAITQLLKTKNAG